MAKKLPKTPFAVWLLRAIASIGILIMGYLIKLHYAGSGAGAVCELGEGFSCEAVNTSIYSEVLGVPVAFLGLAYFAFILFLSLRKLSPGVWKIIFLTTLFSLTPSLYLTGTEIFLIKSICLFCEVSKVLMLVVLGVSFKVLKDEDRLPDKATVFLVLAAGVFAAFQTWFLQTRSVKQANLAPLAQCMTDEGVVMYGAFTCSACARQKQIFGDSFEYIKEVECDPRGKDAQPELCLSKDIRKTPTWVREQEGAEKGRLVGVQSPERLAEFAGCEAALVGN